MGRKRDLIKDYPDEALVEEVRRVAGLVGKPVLTPSDFTSHSEIDARALARRFGGWRVLLERAGMGHMYSEADEEPARIHSFGYSDEHLCEEIQRVAKLVEKPILTTTDLKKHSKIVPGTFSNRFGSWRDALQRAGLGHMHSGHHSRDGYSDDELLEEVRRVVRLVGYPAGSGHFKRNSKIGLSTLKRRFGGFRKALERAGMVHETVHGSRVYYSDEELLREVRRVAELVDRPVLTQSDFNRHSKVVPTTLWLRFGQWPNVLERAGVGHMFSGAVYGHTRPLGRMYSDEKMLDEMRRVAQLTGKRIVSTTDFGKT